MKSAVGSLTVWLAAANVLQLFLGLGRSKLLAHWLGVKGFGELGSLLAVVTIADAAAQAGLSQVVTREIAARPGSDGRIFGTSLILRLAFAVAAGAFLLARGGAGPWGALMLAGMAGQLGVTVLRAKLVRGPQMTANLLPGVLTLAAVAILATATGPSAPGALMALALGYALAAGAQVALAVASLKTRLSWRARDAAWFLGESWPLWLGGIAVAFSYRLSVLFMEFLLPPESKYQAIGYFQSVYTLVESGNFILGALVMTAFPVFSSLRSASTEKLRAPVVRSLTVALAAGAFACAGTIVLGGWAIRLVFNADFLPALPALRILSAALVLVPLNSLLGSLLTAVGKQKAFLAVILAQTLFNAAANYFAIPKYGFAGAAAVSVVTEMLGLVLMLRLARPLLVGNGKGS